MGKETKLKIDSNVMWCSVPVCYNNQLFFQEQPEIVSDKKANGTQSNKKLKDISSNHVLVSSVEA